MANNINKKGSQVLKVILTLLIMFLFFFTPFTVLNLKEKFVYLNHKNEFTKLRVRVDSIQPIVGTSIGGSSTLYGYDVHYNNPKEKVSLDSPEGDVFIWKQDKDDYRHFFKIYDATPFYLPMNDSIWVWHHKNIPDRYAVENEPSLDTSGFILQIILNIVMLILVLWGVTWQINQWIQIKRRR